MELISSAKPLAIYLKKFRDEGKTIGFVPTMGALHNGHLTLIHQALEQSDIVVCSIFVNPTQFNDPKDLTNYPKPIESDLALLHDKGVHIAFCPTIDTMYPNGMVADVYNLAGLDTKFEGEMRPGHFQGVATIVHRLLLMVEPDWLFLGQKDLQQCRVVEHLIKTISLPKAPSLVICPTIREENGLAMSSRNERLTKKEKELAGTIYESLLWGKSRYLKRPPYQLIKKIKSVIRLSGVLTLEYVSVIDYDTFEEIISWDNVKKPAICIAVKLGNTRLIDNVFLNH